MASERGPYRAIPSVLLDGKDFRSLSERARWVFVALKLNLGPAGIEVHYRRALAEQLAEQTGAGADAVAAALDELEAAGWIEREENIVWVLEQLRFEPNMKPADVKHRKAVQRHAMGLPSLPIVRRFIDHYPAWFPLDEFTTPKGLARAKEGPKKAVRTTEDRRPITENRGQSTCADAPHSEPAKPKKEPTSWTAKACTAWQQKFGGTANGGRIGKALKPLVDQYGDEEVLHVWSLYLATEEERFISPNAFADKYLSWRDGRKPQPHVQQGVMVVNGVPLTPADQKLLQYRAVIEPVDLNSSEGPF